MAGRPFLGGQPTRRSKFNSFFSAAWQTGTDGTSCSRDTTRGTETPSHRAHARQQNTTRRRDRIRRDPGEGGRRKIRTIQASTRRTPRRPDATTKNQRLKTAPAQPKPPAKPKPREGNDRRERGISGKPCRHLPGTRGEPEVPAPSPPAEAR